MTVCIVLFAYYGCSDGSHPNNMLLPAVDDSRLLHCMSISSAGLLERLDVSIVATSS
ncbi:hypothetical protein CY34DRAFT_801923 [Suillus luteus UH-Slu-Lm8-n1]|uniref:Uncharacterized protein n=1 Tax=Suillus luteus UH-Slu-Lm8-n1 TaxID=930992 RepID=A0A0D0AU28_9AGAM|nr:hypothetical protein CY34DRAFT_801923 [Suillus luteus UH-Slu-Lm8-n1]